VEEWSAYFERHAFGNGFGDLELTEF